jgi:hypothetical protein
MVVSDQDAQTFVDGILHAELWLAQGRDRQSDPHRPYVESACALFDDCAETMPTKPVVALAGRSLSSALNEMTRKRHIIGPFGGTYRSGAACLRRILGYLDENRFATVTIECR